MNINVTITFAGMDRIFNLLETIMANQAEVAEQLRTMTAQNEKARQENLAKLAELQAAIEAAGNTTPEVDEALAALKASIQADDDENPDQVAARKAMAAGQNQPQGQRR